MIAKKDKKKKNEKSDIEKYEENIQSMRSWVRKIEQSASGLSGRLKAVEERISSSNRVNPLLNSNFSNNDADVSLDSLNDGSENNELALFSNNLLEEIDILKEEFTCQQSQILSFEDKIDDLNNSLEDTKKEIIVRIKASNSILSDINNRVEKVEDRSPFYMRLGRLELPVEVAGVVCGFVAFVAAVFMYFDMKLLLISPVFLALVGLLFFAAALFKAIKASGLLRNKAKTQLYQRPVSDKSEGFEEKYVA